MKKSRMQWYGTVIEVCALAWLLSACTSDPTAKATSQPDRTPTVSPVPSSTEPPDAVSGVVIDDDGPVPGAVVRVQATDQAATTDSAGRFALDELSPGEPVALTVWAPGYYIVGGDEHVPGTGNIELMLVSHADGDHSSYEWLSAFASAGDEANCQNCHADPDDSSSALPFDEWIRDAHSSSTQNSRFLTMYTGKDIVGNKSPATRFGYSRDYGSFPLRPDPDQPYYGPGYRLDFPDTAGNCAACHAPAASINAPYGTDPTGVTDVGTEGVACDFCHKVWDVNLDPNTGLPFANMPGVLSFQFRRPPEGHQFFAGPYDDVAPGEDTYSPLQQESAYCAPCHFGVFWNTVVYNSFGEWLDSPYSDPETGQTCQDCHMPPGGATHFARPEAGGLERDSETIFSHRMPGASDEILLQNAVTMDVSAERQDNQVVVTVDILNDRTGHHVPTDSPLRHMILLVQATDGDGNSLTQLGGPIVPEWGGVGDPSQGYYAGLPGTAYAKVLQEVWTEVVPTGAYWNPTRVFSDNRIPAMGVDTTTYTFAAPDEGDANIAVTLLFRRAFIQLMDQKGWDVPDIVMRHESITPEEDS